MLSQDKCQDVTLVHSKCSDASFDQGSQLYRAVNKSLQIQRCHQHHQQYQYFYKQRLLCAQCFAEAISNSEQPLSRQKKKKYEHYYHLETILNYPIVLTIEPSELLSQPIELIELTLTSYKQLYQKKSDFKIQKQLLQSFTARLKNRVNELCEQIMDSYLKFEESINSQVSLKEQMKNLGKVYEEQLMEMLSQKFTEGSKDELQAILTEYSANSENPLPKMMANLEEVVSSLEAAPFINTQHLEQLYTSVTDNRIWKQVDIIQTLSTLKKDRYESADMVITDENISLQSQYTLNLQQNEMSLTMDNKVLGNLKVRVDSLYELPNYKLLGVNYDKLMIINYFDKLSLEEQLHVSGCTDALPFPYHIIAISNNNLIKISLETKKYETLGKGYKNLKYYGKNTLNFVCQNQKDEIVHWNCYSQYETPVIC